MKYDSDHPDKSQECYPCSCPDCPGYHECDFIRKVKAYGESGSCDVCGYSARYEPFTVEDIEGGIGHFSQSIKDRFYAGEPVGGKFVTITKHYK